MAAEVTGVENLSIKRRRQRILDGKGKGIDITQFYTQGYTKY